MNEATKAAYSKLSTHFYQTRLGGQQPTGPRVRDALLLASRDYRPAYWRRLRNALTFDQIEKGYSEAAVIIDAAVNPLTSNGDPTKVKQTRAKSVSQIDHQLLIAELQRKGDSLTLAAVFIAYELGCRPAVMEGIILVDNDNILIRGAKKTKMRGIDRNIIMPQKKAAAIKRAVAILSRCDGNVMHIVQNRLQRHTARLWPRRKARVSLYSYRHQLGADLKASGRPREEVAAIMGHASVDSVDVYGDRRAANEKRDIGVTVDSVNSVRKTNYKYPDKGRALDGSKEYTPKPKF